MSFAKGFASVLVDQYNKGTELDHEKQKVDMTEKLRINEEERTRRAKQQEQETLWKSQAEVLAKQVNRPDDPAAISFFLDRLKVDNSDTISEQIREGYVEVPSRNYTNTTVEIPNNDRKVPPAVENVVPKTTTTVEEPSVLKKKFGDPEPTDTTTSAEVKKTEISETPVTKEKEITETFEHPSGFRILPKTKKLEIKSLEELNIEIDEATKIGDKAAVAKYENLKRLKIGAITEEALASGKIKSTDNPVVFLTQKNGKWSYSSQGYTRPNQDGTLENVASEANNTRVNQNQTMIPVGEEDLKYIRELDKQFGTKTADYKTQAAGYSSTLVAIAQLGQVLDADTNALTTSASFAADIDSFVKDVASGLSIIDAQLAKDTSDAVANLSNARKAYDTNKTPENLAAVEQAANSLIVQAQNGLAQGVVDTAANSRLAQAMKIGIIYQLAATNGETAKSMSNLDVQKYEGMLGNPKDKEALYKAMAAAMSPQREKLKGVQLSFKRDAEQASSRLPTYNGEPVDYGFVPPRLDEIVADSVAELDPVLGQSVQELNSYINKGPQAIKTGIGVNPNAQTSQTPVQNDIPLVTTKAERDALPPGTKYRTPKTPPGSYQVRKTQEQ